MIHWVTPVTAGRPAHRYLLLIEQTFEFGEPPMTTAFNTKFLSLVLAAAFFLPAAVATLNQAALIVA
jgi:hypothetical protein